MGQLAFRKGKSSLTIGRMDTKLGLGVVAPGVHDGVAASYAPDAQTTWRVGLGSMNEQEKGALVDSETSVPIFYADASKTIGRTTLTLSHLRTLGHPATTNVWQPWNAGGSIANYYEIPLALEQYAIGLKAPIAKRLWFTGEYVTNRAGGLKEDYSSGTQGRPDATRKSVDRDGWWAGLSYGNLQIDYKYETFFDACAANHVDYDIIGCSYYPFYLRKSVEDIAAFCETFGQKYHRPIMVMETGFAWSKTTATGYQGQLYHNGPYDMTKEAQRAFMQDLYDTLGNLKDVESSATSIGIRFSSRTPARSAGRSASGTMRRMRMPSTTRRCLILRDASCPSRKR